MVVYANLVFKIQHIATIIIFSILKPISNRQQSSFEAWLVFIRGHAVFHKQPSSYTIANK